MTAAEAVLLSAGLLVALAGSGLFSGIETGIYTLNKLRLELGERAGKTVDTAIRRLLADPAGLLCFFLVGNNIMNDLLTVLGQHALVQLDLPVRPEVLTTLVVTPVLFVAGEAVPKALFHTRAESLVRRVWPLMEALRRPLLPLVVLVRPVAVLLSRWLGGALEEGLAGARGREALTLLLSDDAAGGPLSVTQQAMAANVVNLSARSVRTAMVPLPRVEYLPDGTTAGEALSRVRDSAHTLFPVVSGERVVEVLGCVSLLDLLYDAAPSTPLAEFLRPVEVLVENLPIEEALARVAKSGARMGLVASPGGRALGIVTRKDLVEEIMGELRGL